MDADERLWDGAGREKRLGGASAEGTRGQLRLGSGGKISLHGVGRSHTVCINRVRPHRREPFENRARTTCAGDRPMNAAVRTRLSVMMFLEFFIWGAWYPLVFGYLPSLGFGPWEQWLILGTFNLAAVIALFFSSQFADRHFAAEKFVAFSQLIGGGAILGLFWVKSGWIMTLFGMDVNLSFWAFFALMLLHCLFYVPTISITNSIAFANLADPQKDFGPIRLWGTIGWIAASWPFVFILLDWARVPAFGSLPFTEWLGTTLGTSLTGDAKVEG